MTYLNRHRNKIDKIQSSFKIFFFKSQARNWAELPQSIKVQRNKAIIILNN